MDELDVRFLAQPSFKCSNKQLNHEKIFMLVMTLSAPKNFEARNFIRNSIKAWTDKTSRNEGRFSYQYSANKEKNYN